MGLTVLLITGALSAATAAFLAELGQEARAGAGWALNRAMETFHHLAEQKGAEVRVADGVLRFGRYAVDGNHELPDAIRGLFGGTATIFRGDVRVATNVRLPDGRRAVGTALAGPARRAVFEEGRPYRGEAQILGASYLTAYDPLRAPDGRVVGALYVGFRKDEFWGHYERMRREVLGGSLLLEITSVAVAAFLLRAYGRQRAALEESEAKYRHLFEHSADGHLLLDGAVADANGEACRIFGLNRRDLLGGPVPDLPAAPPAAEAGFVPWQRRLPSGEVLHLEVLLTPLEVRGRRMVHVTLRDVTGRVRAEELTRAVHARLIQTNKMTSLGLFAGSLVHEIRNPTAALLAGSALLEDVWADAAPLLRGHAHETGGLTLGGLPFAEAEQVAPRLLAGIGSTCRRISSVLETLKDYVETGGQGAWAAVDVNEVVLEAVGLLWYHSHNATNNVTLRLDEALPPVRGNARQLEQVLVNVLLNAFQSLVGRDAGVAVETAGVPGGRAVTVTVRDEGRGIPPDVMARLKEPFYSTRLAEGGTGLGLYISDATVREHGGTLAVSSAPGEGTTVTVTLPIQSHLTPDTEAP